MPDDDQTQNHSCRLAKVLIEAGFSSNNQQQCKKNSEKGQSSIDPIVLTALLGKRKQLEQIESHVKPAYSTWAFILDGEHDEWPEALRDRLAFNLWPLEYYKQVTSYFLNQRLPAFDALMELLAQFFEMKRNNANFAAVIEAVMESLQSYEKPIVIKVYVEQGNEPSAKMLQEIVKLWEGLDLPALKADCYLLFMRIYVDKNPGFWKRRWHQILKAFRSDWPQQIEKTLREAKLGERWLPRLEPPNVNDVVVTWRQEILDCEHLSTNLLQWGIREEEKRIIESKAKALFFKDEKPIPPLKHRILSDQLVSILKNFPSET